MKRLHVVSRLLLLSLTLCLAAFAEVTVSPTSVTLSGQLNGPIVVSSLTLTPVGAASSGFVLLVSPQVTWLSASAASVSAPTTVTLAANPSGLPVGSYTTTVQVYSSSGTGLPVIVPVAFTISSLGVSPSTLSFAYSTGGTLPSAQSVSVTSATVAQFSATAATTSGGNWLQVAPAAGTTPGSVTAQLNSAAVPGLAAGTYNGSITITPSASVGTPVSIPVTLTVTAPAQVTVAPASMNFAFQTGGTNNTTQQTLTLSSNSAFPVNFGFAVTVDPNPAGLTWVSVNPTGGAIPAAGSLPVTVTVTPGTLPAGIYTAKLSVFAPGATPAQVDIPVRLTVSTLPLLNVTPLALSFTYQVGTSAPSAQNVTPTSTGAALPYGVSIATANGGNWLNVSGGGSTPTPFTVSVNPAGLVIGTYTGTLTVTATGAGNAPLQIPVTLKVSNDPVVTTSVSNLSFAYQVGQSLPQQQSVKVSSTTGAALSYSVSAQPAWLVLGGQTSGNTDGTFIVSVNVSGQAAGAYDGVITITATNPATGVAAVNSPLTIPVRFFVSATPLLVSSTNALSFTGQVAGGSPGAQTVNLSSTSSTDQLSFTATFTTDNGGTWLFVGPLAGSTPNTLVVSVVPSLLSSGTYSGSVKITATGPGGAAVANSPMTIPVTLTMSQGTLSVTPSTLTFAQTLGSAAPAPQALQISASGTPAAFNIAASTGAIAVTWLTVSVPSGTTPATVNVSADGSRLTPGTYSGTVTVTAAGVAGSPFSIPVTFTVSGGTIAATPATVAFSAIVNGPQPAAQTINISSSSGALNFTAAATSASGGNWLQLNNTSGTTPGSLSLSVNANSLGVGTYTGSVVITAPGATGSPLTIPVTLTVVPGQTLAVSPASLTFSYTAGLAVPAAQTFQISSSGGAAPFTITTQTSAGGTWLAVSPTSGTTSATINVAVTPQSLPAGNYTAAITVNSPNAIQPQTVNLSLTVLAIPPPNATNIVNAATFAPGTVVPGEFITLGGTGLGPTDLIIAGPDSSGFYPTTFGDTQVLFDETPAPIYYVSARQTSVIVPYQVAGRVSTNMVVVYKGVRSTAVSLRVGDVSPGIYCVNQAGSGPGVILNQNYSLNTANNAAAKGSVVVVYANGEGQTSPAGVTGQVIPADINRLKRPLQAVTATIGGQPATVQYAGSAGGLVSGVFQVNILVPANAPSGAAVPITISVGTTSTQAGVTMAIQ